MTETALSLPAPLRERMLAAARRALPAEACGLLIGSPGRVDDVTVAPNLDAERTTDRFTLDPGHLVEAELEAEASGRSVLGVWHSHPRGPAVPSDGDRAAAWPGWTHVIVSVPTSHVTAWRFHDRRAVETRMLE